MVAVGGDGDAAELDAVEVHEADADEVAGVGFEFDAEDFLDFALEPVGGFEAGEVGGDADARVATPILRDLGGQDRRLSDIGTRKMWRAYPQRVL